MKKKYFGNNIPPMCAYCLFGNLTLTGDKVLCEKTGLVDCSYKCKYYIYDPIKRIPKKQIEIAQKETNEI